MEGLHVADQVIRRQHEHHRVGIRALQRKRGDRDRRRGVAPDRLEDLGTRRRIDRAQLLGDEEAVLVVAHDRRRLGAGEPAQPLDRLLQHRPLGDERQELLRQQLPRHRPEPAAGAAAEHDWIEPRCHCRILTAGGCGFAPRIARLRDRRPPPWALPETSSPACLPPRRPARPDRLEEPRVERVAALRDDPNPRSGKQPRIDQDVEGVRRDRARDAQGVTTSRILVTGATGFVGRALVRRLLADGRTVRAAVRPASAALPAASRDRHRGRHRPRHRLARGARRG